MRRPAIALIALAAGLGAAGCGEKEEPDLSTVPQAETLPTTSVPTTATPTAPAPTTVPAP